MWCFFILVSGMESKEKLEETSLCVGKRIDSVMVWMCKVELLQPLQAVSTDSKYH